jgi:hypothetical protein
MNNDQYAWGHALPLPATNLMHDEWETLIRLVMDECKTYKDDDTAQLNARLLGKLLILANT